MLCTTFAIDREVVGSIVEQSMKSRLGSPVPGEGTVGFRIEWKTDDTWAGPGSTVMITDLKKH